MQKVKWSNLLKRDLVQFPPSGREYHTPDNLIITITTQKKVRERHFTFGGHYSSTLYFHSNDAISVTFLSPIRKPFTVLQKDIVRVVFTYMNP